MAREVIQTVWNEHVRVQVKRRRYALREDIGDVVIRVPPVVELCPKRILPLLGLHDIVRVRRMQDEAFELQLTNALDLRPDLESQICECLIGIGPFNKAYFGIEVWPDFPTLDDSVQPVRAIG